VSVLVCRICHRCKIDGDWGHLGGVEADHVRICPTCLGWQTRVQQAKARQQDRKLLRDRERGYGGPAEGEDVFRGMREPGADKARG